MIFGIDVASYQSGINMRQAKQEGIQFVIVKMTEGQGYASPVWKIQARDARQSGMLVAGYHYLTKDSMTAQAAKCKREMDSFDVALPVMLDWEDRGGDGNNLRAAVREFRRAGLRVVFGYVPPWYWNQAGRPNLADLGLAIVASGYPGGAGTPAQIYKRVGSGTWGNGYGGVKPTILQFTDQALVAGLKVDCNAYPGTIEQLTSLFDGTTAFVEDDFMATLSDAEKATLMEAANSVLFGATGVRPAGPMALKAAGIETSINTAVIPLLQLIASSGGVDVDEGAIANQVIAGIRPLIESAVEEALGKDNDGQAQKILDALSARLAK